MADIYRCPACQGALNPEHAILLVSQIGKTRTLIGFHPEPGNYELYLSPDAQVEPGQPAEFLCPICHTDLKTAEDDKLCMVLRDSHGQVEKVMFSRKAGERATFVISGTGTVQALGEASDKFSYLQMRGVFR